MTETPVFNFRQGGAEASEEAASQTGIRPSRIEYFSLKKKGDSCFVRYITDYNNLVYADMIPYCPTKAKPNDYPYDNWPSSVRTVSRYDTGFGGYYKDCYPLDAGLRDKFGKTLKPKVRNFSVACLREPVIATQEHVDAGHCTEAQIGTRIGFTDAKREVADVDADGKMLDTTHWELALVVINEASNTFFDNLGSMHGVYGTVCDRDYQVRREAEGTETSYANVPLSETPNLHPGTESWQRYPAAMKEQGIDLNQIVGAMASDDHYAKWIDPNKTFPWPKKEDKKGGSNQQSSSTDSSGAGASSGPTAPQNTAEPDQEQLANMRNRLRNRGQSQEPQSEQEPQQVQDQQQAPEQTPAANDTQGQQESQQAPQQTSRMVLPD